jgi:Ergosterol biosynthesis ERG4/ERG24 family
MMHRSAQRHYEFCGPRLGPLAIIVGLPAVLYGLIGICNARGCLALWPRLRLPGWPLGTPLFTWQACGVWLGWLAFQVGLHLLLPGRRLQGTELRDGSRLTYKLTGRRLLCIAAGHCNRSAVPEACSWPAGEHGTGTMADCAGCAAQVSTTSASHLPLQQH